MYLLRTKTRRFIYIKEMNQLIKSDNYNKVSMKTVDVRMVRIQMSICAREIT